MTINARSMGRGKIGRRGGEARSQSACSGIRATGFMSDGIWLVDGRIQLARGEFGKGRAIPSRQREAGRSIGEGFGWALDKGERRELVGLG